MMFYWFLKYLWPKKISQSNSDKRASDFGPFLVIYLITAVSITLKKTFSALPFKFKGVKLKTFCNTLSL